MTKLIRPLTLKGSCLLFSNQDHDLGSTICRSRGHNDTTYFLMFGRVKVGLGVLRYF